MEPRIPMHSLTPTLSDSVSLPARSSSRPAVSWGAILAGLAATMALLVVCMLLGAGLGFAFYTPLTDEDPVKDLGTGVALTEGISAVVSLWFGGWVAGRFVPIGGRGTGRLHGFIVWCLAMLAGVLLLSSVAGWASSVAKILGGGVAWGDKPTAVLADGTELAHDNLKQSANLLASFTDEALGNRADSHPQFSPIRARREISTAIARFFNPASDANARANRAALVKAIARNTNMSEAEADQTVADWSVAYDELKVDLNAAKNEAETRARAQAHEASHELALFSFCSFAALAMGGLSASFGGHVGANAARRSGAVAPARS